jgi:demethylmenaquinone methyltransferase/2-methoxy-6-polyprenyl-1,4-benzoquinol methylase
MPVFDHDTVVPYKTSSREKKEQVAEMFNNIAGRYDFLNRFLSAGIDLRWRKKAIRQLASLQPKTMLDVATGTADMALLADQLLHPDKIIGIDISEGMLDVGRQKINQQGRSAVIELLKGDSEAINFPNDTFDAVMVAFGVRNFQDLERGLSEIRRVLKPGGRLVILEFSKPKAPVVKTIYQLYMKWITPGLGKLFSKNREAYQYLDESIRRFPEREKLVAVMNQTGYQQSNYKTLSLGICCIYCGEK